MYGDPMSKPPFVGAKPIGNKRAINTIYGFLQSVCSTAHIAANFIAELIFALIAIIFGVAFAFALIAVFIWSFTN